MFRGCSHILAVKPRLRPYSACLSSTQGVSTLAGTFVHSGVTSSIDLKINPETKHYLGTVDPSSTVEYLSAFWALQKQSMFVRSPSKLNPMQKPPNDTRPPPPMHMRCIHQLSRAVEGILSTYFIIFYDWSLAKVLLSSDKVWSLKGSWRKSYGSMAEGTGQKN